MATAVKQKKSVEPSKHWGSLPPRMRVLLITGYHRTGGWLAEAFATDSASEVLLEEAVGTHAGLTRLRDEVFDTVLISHHADELDALELLEAIRAGNGDGQPIIVLGEQSQQEMNALCYEVGADAYVCVNTSTTRALIWTVARAMERHRLKAENRRLIQEQRHRLQLENDEAHQLLEQQRGLIEKLADTHTPGWGQSTPGWNDELSLPQPLVIHYQELLQAYVVMGSGNLNDEMTELTDAFALAGITARQAMLLHLSVLGGIIKKLGSRSARHVMNRANMLILEVMINLTEGYHQLYLRRLHPARQMVLPGFGEPAEPAFDTGRAA